MAYEPEKIVAIFREAMQMNSGSMQEFRFDIVYYNIRRPITVFLFGQFIEQNKNGISAPTFVGGDLWPVRD